MGGATRRDNGVGGRSRGTQEVHQGMMRVGSGTSMERDRQHIPESGDAHTGNWGMRLAPKPKSRQSQTTSCEPDNKLRVSSDRQMGACHSVIWEVDIVTTLGRHSGIYGMDGIYGTGKGE